MDIQILKDHLKRDEGVRNIPYRDSVGKLTIGVGHNLDDKPISLRAIDVILEDDINDSLNDLYSFLPWVRGLDDNRQIVLANMAFNMGIHSLIGFKHTLDFIRNGDYKSAAQAMRDSTWAKQVGNRATRLIHIMETGELI